VNNLEEVAASYTSKRRQKGEEGIFSPGFFKNRQGGRFHYEGKFAERVRGGFGQFRFMEEVSKRREEGSDGIPVDREEGRLGPQVEKGLALFFCRSSGQPCVESTQRRGSWVWWVRIGLREEEERCD